MAIWVGACLYKPEIFDEFLKFQSDDKTVEDFVLSGLVACKETKIRQDFAQSFLALSKCFELEKR